MTSHILKVQLSVNPLFHIRRSTKIGKLSAAAVLVGFCQKNVVKHVVGMKIYITCD
jgi:hypothetical protein